MKNPIHNKNEEHQLCHQGLFLVFIMFKSFNCYQSG